jgi:hypothetical protein
MTCMGSEGMVAVALICRVVRSFQTVSEKNILKYITIDKRSFHWILRF